jgi:hypothetical protein
MLSGPLLDTLGPRCALVLRVSPELRTLAYICPMGEFGAQDPGMHWSYG